MHESSGEFFRLFLPLLTWIRTEVTKICGDEYFSLSLNTTRAACGDGDVLTVRRGLELGLGWYTFTTDI